MRFVVSVGIVVVAFCIYLMWAGTVSIQKQEAVWPWEAPVGSPGAPAYVCTPRQPMFWDGPGPSYNCTKKS
jgi:hypothetical protein